MEEGSKNFVFRAEVHLLPCGNARTLIDIQVYLKIPCTSRKQRHRLAIEEEKRVNGSDRNGLRLTSIDFFCAVCVTIKEGQKNQRAFVMGHPQGFSLYMSVKIVNPV